MINSIFILVLQHFQQNDNLTISTRTAVDNGSDCESKNGICIWDTKRSIDIMEVNKILFAPLGTEL